MKKCSEIKELISLYIDDELELKERSEFEEHIDSCEECRNELDELKQIVELCRNNEEELPVNFKVELHQKLLDVQKQTEVAVNPVFFRNKYFKLFSSVAAVFLLVFLIRGFYGFDLFSNGKTASSQENVNMMAAVPAQDQRQMKSAVSEADDTVKYSLKDSGDTADNFNGEDQYAQAAGSEVDRSTKGRVPKVEPTIAGDGSESVSKNATSITVVVDDPDSQIENIKSMAFENFGLEQPAVSSENTDFAYTTDGSSVIISLNIPNMQLNTFIDALYAGYGKSNVQPDAVISEDLSVVVEGLLKQSDNLDIEIENAQNSDDSGEVNLDSLKEQKTKLQNQIDTIRLETDITNVKVILQKK